MRSGEIPKGAVKSCFQHNFLFYHTSLAEYVNGLLDCNRLTCEHCTIYFYVEHSIRSLSTNQILIGYCSSNQVLKTWFTVPFANSYLGITKVNMSLS